MALQASKLPATRGDFRRMAANMPDQPQNEPTDAQRAEARKWFNPIFREVCVHCPGWKTAIPDDGIETTARVWFETLTSRRELLNPDVLKRGMRNLQAKRLTWLPSPLDFVDLCLEPDGVPSVREAFSEVRSKAHGAKFREKDKHGNYIPIEYRHPIIKHLAGKCGGLFLTGIGEKQAREAFGDEYRLAVEAFKRGDFDEPKNRQMTHQPMDASLAHYFRLVRDFSHMPEIAEEYLRDCRDRGIYIDPENETVTRDAGMVDHSRQRGVSA